jgi:molecular chaperone GrpE
MPDEKPGGQPDTNEEAVEVEVAPAEPAAGPGLEERVATLEKEKQETYERLLRTAADLDNFRKRSRKDLDDARFKAREDVLREILPGIDNLERAVAAGGTSPEGVLEGVRLVLRQFQTALERVDVKSFESVGQPFDPTRHEAIAQVETADQPAGSVVTEMQRGYTIGSRLLRPALVTVAKAPPAPAAASDLPDEEDPSS